MANQSLQDRPAQGNAAGANPQLLFHYHVAYMHDDAEAILAPGQVLPIWNSKDLRLMTDFALHAYMGVRLGEEIISAQGSDIPKVQMVEDALDLEDGEIRYDPAVSRTLHRLRGINLGAVGGEYVIRPDRIALGGIPMERRRSRGDQPQLQLDDMSVLDFWATVGQLQMVEDNAKLPRFFYEAKDGEYDAASPVDGKSLRVRELQDLPFSFETAEALHLSKSGMNGDGEYVVQMLSAVRKLVDRLEISGPIYMGFDLPDATEMEGDVMETPLTLAAYMEGQGFENPCYVLPYDRENPFAALNDGARQKALALMGRGGVRRVRRMPTPSAPPTGATQVKPQPLTAVRH